MSSHSPLGLSGMDPATFTMLQQLAKAAAASKLVKGAYGQSATESQCLMKLLYGHDLGIPATAALTGIQIYDGQMEVGSRLLAGLVQRHPTYGYEVKSCTDGGCTLTFLRNGLPVEDVSYDIDHASRAGLLTGDWYAKHPEAMFFARAMSTMVARHCPDVTHGIPVYAEGEIQAGIAARAAQGNGGAAAPSRPADAIVTDEDVSAIKQAAKDAGVSDGQLYNVIAVVAGGRGGVEAEQAAQRLAQVWERMPQRYRTPVLAALAAPQLVAAAQTAGPANGDLAARNAAPDHASANGRAGEPLASEADARRVRAVAAEMHVDDSALLDVIADVTGAARCDDTGRAASELLPAALAVMALRFVQPVLTRLRPARQAGPSVRSEDDQQAPRSGEAPAADAPPAAGQTVSIAFSTLQPQPAIDAGASDADADAQQQQAA